MEKISLNNGSIKSHLCRYLPLDINLLKSLEQGYLWFSSYSSFNDPYDCNLKIIIENTAQEIKEMLLKAYEEYPNKPQKLTENDIEAKATFYADNPNVFINELIRQDIENKGICCFSQEDDIILMWSHYALKHTGVCLKFDITKDKDTFYVPYKIDYPTQLPKFNYCEYRMNIEQHKGKLVQFVLGTKHKSWDYEDEVRIVRDGTNQNFIGPVPFKKESLIEVIFGCKCKEESISSVIQVLKNNSYSAEIKKMKESDSEFCLKKEQHSH